MLTTGLSRGWVNNMGIRVEDIQDHNAPYWYDNLLGMLKMVDQIIRIYGDDEESFRKRIGDYMWELVVRNLDADTKPRHEGEEERCGTFPKFKGEPGISHLIAEAYPRPVYSFEKSLKPQDLEDQESD